MGKKYKRTLTALTSIALHVGRPLLVKGEHPEGNWGITYVAGSSAR
jgi:hypothetical protein